MTSPGESRAARGALRAVVCLVTLAITAYATAELARVFPGKGRGALEIVMLALFVPCSAWATFGAVLALLGAAATLWPNRAPAPSGEALAGARTAVLVPIHEEDPARVTAQVEVMFRALRARADAPAIDFFLLSDSSRVVTWLAEQAAWRALCERLDAFGRIFYRRRGRPEGKKAGNIRHFCLRHGRDYRYLVVLDADSVMAAETLCALVARMEANPRVGIIQVPPLPVRRGTVFARWQQFAARVYGPIWARAEALLAGPDGNYYGHNAILRTEAFCLHAGLGELPGEGPLSGPIASHDFVEAALVRRAGFEVRLATDLGGSYEQYPTTLVDYAARDRRWCQGNLQHLRVVMLPGLAAWSRMHLLRGACSYLVSPLSLAFSAVTLLVAAHDLVAERAYFLEARRTLFPLWPTYDFAAARELFLWMMAVLFGPRLVAAGLALLRMLRDDVLPRARAPAFLASVLLEWAMGVLFTPSLMFQQSVFVWNGLVGERDPWKAQRRDEHRVHLREALRLHLPHALAILGLAAASLLVSAQALLWTLPLTLPLLASPLLTTWSSSPALGRWADRLGLLQVPEDWSTAPALTVYDVPPAQEAPAVAAPDAVRALLADREACASHALTVIGSGLVQRLPDARRSELRRRLWSGEPLEESELHSCLTDVELLLGALSPRTSGEGDRREPACRSLF
jgi:membrane glycosyltransferase